DKVLIKNRQTKAGEYVLALLDIPERLLATILISSNLINIGIVIIASYITASLFDFSQAPTLGFLIQVVVITFLLLVFGEFLPKLYANHNPLRFALFMAPTLFFLEKAFWLVRFSWLLTSSTKLENRFSPQRKNISIDELGEALELATSDIDEDKIMLEGIVKLRNIEVREIMKSRVDVTAIDIQTPFSQLNQTIIKSGYSRVPVYDNSFDNIKGILFVKDLLPHLQKSDSFKWQTLIRPAYYVPETKKVSSLLKEFQSKKMHLAVVIDEYGGSSGIITLEDVLEEIVGEITDESDEVEKTYIKLDDSEYIFEAKILLHDLCKILDIDMEIFEDVRGDAETLAGLILELRGEIPEIGQSITYKNFIFTIKSVDDRRIKQIHVKIF
ncbi:MAG: gliding motility-associated protein GldE, partial [Bacteroidota bacterium]